MTTEEQIEEEFDADSLVPLMKKYVDMSLRVFNDVQNDEKDMTKFLERIKLDAINLDALRSRIDTQLERLKQLNTAKASSLKFINDHIEVLKKAENAMLVPKEQAKP